MFFSAHSRDYVADIEHIGAEALARGRAKEARSQTHRQDALDKLKLLAVEQAIAVERLRWPFSGPRLDDPSFKRKVQDTAADLLFQAHLHLSTS
jgi:hypothetical protein